MADDKMPVVDFDTDKEIVLELSHPDQARMIEAFPVPPSPAATSEKDEKMIVLVEEKEETPESPIRSPAPIMKKPVPSAPEQPHTPVRPVLATLSRPMTSSTNRFSLSSSTQSKRRIKYGTGKYALVELVPQPSDDSDDPLNWPTWRKELNFYTLLLCVTLIGVMKTALLSVNGVLALGYSISYTAAVALTGVPLILSALTGLVSVVAARFWGRRPAYLASMASIFIGSMWNMRVADSYGQCMAARGFQGLGWGAFDTLVLGSIHDTFFEHEHYTKVAVYRIVNIAATWGGPLLGGVVSQHSEGFSLQFVILNAFLAVAVLLLVFAAPETSFDRSAVPVSLTPATGWSSKYVPLVPRGTVTKQRVLRYIKDVTPPYSFYGPSVDSALLLQAPRAMIAPTTLLLFLVSFLPHCTLWGVFFSLALLFEPMPFMLRPASLGALLLAPFLLSVAATAALALLPAWNRSFVPRMNTAAIAGGSALFFTGLLAFGVYTSDCMLAQPAADASMFSIDGVGSHLSLPAVSFILGLAVAGACVLNATVRPLVRRSTQFTSSNMAVAVRNTIDMEAGLATWQTLFAGVFVLAIPNAVWLWDGLRATSVGIAVAQVVVSLGVGAAWWFWDEVFRRVDGRIMGCVDMSLLKRTGSFFDDD